MNRLFLRVAITVGAAFLRYLPQRPLWELAQRFERFRTISYRRSVLSLAPTKRDPHSSLAQPSRFGEGWDGAQETHSEWCVGKGLTRRAPALAGRTASVNCPVAIGICVVRLGPPYSTAISRFKALTTLTAGASTPSESGLSRRLLPRSRARRAFTPTRHHTAESIFCPVGSRSSSTCAERRCSCGSRSPPVRQGRQRCADSCGR